jgi:hypothetical protein
MVEPGEEDDDGERRVRVERVIREGRGRAGTNQSE